MAHDEIASVPAGKRDRLLQESIREFAEHGYAQASTNRIVQRVGIAKGSLFHYFGTKERLYLAILDGAAEELRGAVAIASRSAPTDPIERVVALARAEFGFHAANPKLYRLFRRAVTDSDTAAKVRERYADSGMTLFLESLAGAEFAPNVDKRAAIEVLAWVVNGLNEVFLPSARTTDEPTVLSHRYESELRRYLAVVAPCIRGADPQ